MTDEELEALERTAKRDGDMSHALVKPDMLLAIVREVRELRAASRLRPDYAIRCGRCGAPHWIDTSLPSDVWNQIAEPHEELCMLCIEDALREKGLTAQAEFHYAGEHLQGAPYQSEEVRELRAERERLDLIERHVLSSDGLAIIEIRDWPAAPEEERVSFGIAGVGRYFGRDVRSAIDAARAKEGNDV